MSARSFNFYVSGFLDGTTELVRPPTPTAPNPNLFPQSELLGRGQGDYEVNGPVGIIDWTEFFGAKSAFWVCFIDVEGPNLGLIDPVNSVIQGVRSPGAPNPFYQPGSGSQFTVGVIPAGYVQRLELRDAGNALVPGPWRIYTTIVPLRTAEDICCVCELATQGGGGCEPPVLADVSPSLVDAGLLGPPPYTITLTGSGFVTGDVVLIEPDPGPGPGGTVNVITTSDNEITVEWTPGPIPGDYLVTVVRGDDPECTSDPQPLTYVPPA